MSENISNCTLRPTWRTSVLTVSLTLSLQKVERIFLLKDVDFILDKHETNFALGHFVRADSQYVLILICSRVKSYYLLRVQLNKYFTTYLSWYVRKRTVGYVSPANSNKSAHSRSPIETSLSVIRIQGVYMLVTKTLTRLHRCTAWMRMLILVCVRRIHVVQRVPFLKLRLIYTMCFARFPYSTSARRIYLHAMELMLHVQLTQWWSLTSFYLLS